MTALDYLLTLVGTLAVSFAVFIGLIPFGLMIGRTTFTDITDSINWGM